MVFVRENDFSQLTREEWLNWYVMKCCCIAVNVPRFFEASHQILF